MARPRKVRVQQRTGNPYRQPRVLVKRVVDRLGESTVDIVLPKRALVRVAALGDRDVSRAVYLPHTVRTQAPKREAGVKHLP